MPKRTFWYSNAVDDEEYVKIEDEVRVQVYNEAVANLVSSQTDQIASVFEDENDPNSYLLHMPIIDLDQEFCRHEIVDSQTPGNHHLYINKTMTWEDCLKLLNVLEEIGIIQPGFAQCSKERGMIFARLPRKVNDESF